MPKRADEPKRRTQPIQSRTLYDRQSYSLNGKRSQNEKMHVYELRPRKDKRGFDLISDALPFDRLWYGEPNAIGNAVSYVKFYSRSHDAVIRIYDEAGTVIETHEHAGDFKEW
jgi:hypothetical protein